MKRPLSNLISPRARRLGLAFGTLVAGIAASGAYAAEPTNRLEAIDVQTLPAQQVQLTFRLSGPAPEPLAFTIDNPARISVDLADTAVALPSRRIDVRSGGLDTVLAAEAGGRTRVVLNLDHLEPYTTTVQGNNIIMVVGTGGPSPTVASGGGAPALSRVAQRAAAMAGVRAIRAIDFRRGGDGVGRVIVKLSDPRTPVDVHQVGDQVIVDFSGTDVAKDLVRRYDALDFATPVSHFDVMKVGDNTRIVINATGDFEQLAYQTDDQYVIEVQKTRKANGPVDEKREYTGERLTLNFQDIETRAVLQLLADASGQNIVVSDSVKGSVTLRLQNVPWDQALDIVLRTQGLDKRRQDNVIIVAPTEELAVREKSELAARKDIQELAPLRFEFLQVNYAKAADLAKLIKTQAGSLLSTRGHVAVDDRTNTLLLQDTSDRLAEIRRMVGTLDIPVRQVLIETRVVIVNDDFNRQLGAVVGFTQVGSNGSNGLWTTSGSAAATDSIVSSALTNLASSTTASPFPVTIPTGTTGAPERYNVNLPVSSPAGSIALGVLSKNFLVDLELSAAQAEGRGEVVSSPRVITANQTEAAIEQGTEIPYQQSASSGATSIEFKKAVLSLKVKPQITPDNRIILDIDVSDDTVGQVIVASGGVNVPAIDTRAIKTQVLVNDGQTVVLGGILDTNRTESVTKVPYLGDIPILGNLFKTTNRTNNKDELLIFVTPKILREGVNTY